MASDMLCCQGGTFRHDGCHDKGQDRPRSWCRCPADMLGWVRSSAVSSRSAP